MLGALTVAVRSRKVSDRAGGTSGGAPHPHKGPVDLDSLERDAFAEARAAGMETSVFSAFLRPLQALKAHSDGTWAHCLRVGICACRFARSGTSGVAPASALRCGIAHDAGKLDVPAEVLEAEPFGPEHYAVVKGHALAGFRHLASHDPEAALVAGLHHAFQANPYGLAPAGIAPAILALAKAVAACDFADALAHRHDGRYPEAERSPKAARGVLAAAFPDQQAYVTWLADNVLAA